VVITNLLDKTQPNLSLTAFEKEIMNTVERAGWHADLWFPVVERSRLGLRSVATDQDVHAAVVGLIRKRALVHVDPEGWRPPNFSPPPDIRGPILPSPGYLALAHRMPLVQPGPVELALETADRSDQVASQAFSTKPHYRVEDEKTGLSELEAHILTSIDHVGWYAHLWFPAVARGMLNFGSKEREENVHSAIIGLIRKGALVLTNSEEISQWGLAPGVLE